MSLAAETNGHEVTSWIPLTNVFTPSPGCESIFRLNGPSLVAFDPGYGLDIDTAVKCAPSAVTTWWEQARLGVGGDDHTAISIQPLTCPHLWTTVATFAEDRTTTQIMCCPSGYSNLRATSGSVNGDCISSVSRGAVLTYAATDAGESTDWSTVTTTLSASSSVGAIAVVGVNIARATSTATSNFSASPTSSSPYTSSSSPLNEQPSPTDTTAVQSSTYNGMSTGVKVGIGVGTSLGVLGLSALIITVVLFRRQHRSKPGKSQAVVPGAAFGVEDKSFNTSHRAPQAYHDFPHEIQSRPLPSEMPSDQVHSPIELDSHNCAR